MQSRNWLGSEATSVASISWFRRRALFRTATSHPLGWLLTSANTFTRSAFSRSGSFGSTSRIFSSRKASPGVIARMRDVALAISWNVTSRSMLRAVKSTITRPEASRTASSAASCTSSSVTRWSLSSRVPSHRSTAGSKAATFSAKLRVRWPRLPWSRMSPE